jgi:hypothetical protein
LAPATRPETVDNYPSLNYHEQKFGSNHGDGCMGRLSLALIAFLGGF